VANIIETAKKALSMKRSVRFPQATMDALEEIARERGKNVNWVINMLLERGLVIEGVVTLGGKVIAVDPSGEAHIIADNRREVISRR
jgi:hypothetical protein